MDVSMCKDQIDLDRSSGSRVQIVLPESLDDMITKPLEGRLIAILDKSMP
jgi:hypothetical protein